jgi:hypothetical protein
MAILIEKGKSTPYVFFDNGIMEIAGQSIPEHAVNFYDPILEEILEYIKKPKEKTIVNLSMDYVNSASMRCLVKILSPFEELYSKGFDVIMIWHVSPDDDTMIDLGKDFKSMIQLPFEMKYLKKDQQ